MIKTSTMRSSHAVKGAGALLAVGIMLAFMLAMIPQALAVQKNITTDMVTAIPNQTYTGKELEPELTIQDGSYTLVKGTDYKVTYSNNINVGQATASITGVGNYTGTLAQGFSITPKSVTSVVTIDAIEDQTYTGKELKPTIVVKDGTTTLIEDKDYTVAYEDNIDVGVATVTITGKGNYTDKQSANFNVVKANLSKAVVVGKDQKYTGSAVTTKVTVTLNGVTLTEDKDFTVGPYYNNTEVGEATVAIKGVGNCEGDAIGTFFITEPVTMHRLYNPNSGEHFYTASADEKDWLVGLGWNDEGTGWIAPSHSATPVFRLYNENGGEHHYTMDADEKNALIEAGWKDEGTGWYSDDDKTTKLFREYNPNAFANNHNYTTDEAEHNNLVSLGWNDEGEAWFGLAAPTE